jgi:LacI family transcriptional regulator
VEEEKNMAATLKDIAQATQVTTTSVHRALHGKPGLSDATRAEILRVAAEMGYQADYKAALMKRRDIRIAIVMPEPTFDSRYYYNNLWKGARAFLADRGEFSITPLEYPYPLAQGANGAALKDIFEKHAGNLDGLLTIAVDHSQSPLFIEKLADKGVPVVFVGGDMYADKRLCCVKAYDGMAGSLAAELLTAFDCGAEPRQVIVTGDFAQTGMRDQQHNVAGFEAYLSAHAPHAGILRIHDEDPVAARAQIEEALGRHPDVHAIYASSARHTVRMSEAVLALGLQGKIKLIGSGLFEESAALLKQDVLTAIIDRRIPRQSYLAMKVLFDYVFKGESPADRNIYVKPAVVLKSNVEIELGTDIRVANPFF